jgi:hypothetical protein
VVGDPRGVVGAEEGHRRGDVFRLADAPSGYIVLSFSSAPGWESQFGVRTVPGATTLKRTPSGPYRAE